MPPHLAMFRNCSVFSNASSIPKCRNFGQLVTPKFSASRYTKEKSFALSISVVGIVDGTIRSSRHPHPFKSGNDEQ